MREAMKRDQETAMRALHRRVQKAVTVEMVLTNSKRYDSKSNGKVEKAIQEIDGHIRTLKLHTKDRIGKTIPRPSGYSLDGGYAAEVINLFRVIKNKMTPREAIRGNHALRRMFEF